MSHAMRTGVAGLIAAALLMAAPWAAGADSAPEPAVTPPAADAAKPALPQASVVRSEAATPVPSPALVEAAPLQGRAPTALVARAEGAPNNSPAASEAVPADGAATPPGAKEMADAPPTDSTAASEVKKEAAARAPKSDVASADPAKPKVARGNPLGLQALDSSALANRRGAADVFSDMQLKAVVAENQAVNVSTGNNVISDNAFSHASGVPMVVQNTGNNVLIQNATILNVQVK
ncbi:hypothetical protein [Piscinibacter koreensis]|uniref:Uncharacterized protein n=1 Tax=Piscinibacter koreensis TaxID=2742824 RepID=A0A7Y6TW45_9BURK|nr:hypothetical protein [Schlegelella koreensis]NUZ05749.1 hypothetical protein [Schlegelella koreensis]